ncbi:MAG: 2-hydroxyacid dehydrogenase [Victivallaceae bacterium]
MKKIKVAFFDTKPYDRKSFDAANGKFGFELAYFETRLNPASARMAEGFDVVSAFVNDDLGSKTIEVLAEEKIRMIAMRCAGYNNVDLAAARGKMVVVRVPGYSPYAVAEYALAMYMTLNRALHRAYNRVRENNFSINGLIGSDLRGKTVGIIGTGRIGQVFAEILQGYGVRILAYDMFPNKEAAEKLHIEYVPLDTLYRESDVISLHCPLTKENDHMIDLRAIREMKDGIYIINTSRGKLIDTAALILGLKSGKVGGACLDVYEEEGDYFFEDRSNGPIIDDVLARLLTFPNVLVTSHQAFFTREALRNIASVTLENIRAYFESNELPNGICEMCDGSKNCTVKPCGK